MLDDPLSLWAKTAAAGDDDPAAFHPLLCHLLDVGAVAARLWTASLPESARSWFARQIGLDVESAGRWTSFLAAMHDWGKGTPAFLERRRIHAPVKHGTMSTFLLRSALSEPSFGIAQDVASRLATVIGGHHGVFPRADDILPLTRDTNKTQTGLGRWKDHQRWLLDETGRLLAIAGTRPPGRLTNPGAVWLAGFISVADWIGSNRDFFPYAAPSGQVPDGFSIDAYLERARERADRAIAALGWAAWPEQSDSRSFTDLFALTPNAMQTSIVALANELHEPSLVIIEAPMGMGKTEAALYLADHGNVALGMRGHYLALPTQATSNQLFTRDVAFLRKRYPDEIVNTQLLHGHAALASDFAALKASAATFLAALDIPALDQHPVADGSAPGVVAAEWFTARKRGLLAPYGVGTIDQALLAVLQTRHFFVRLLGLAGKTIIFDEVHAYDTYMSALLDRLLAWLAALGCSVTLLSATLPAARRAALLGAWTGEEISETFAIGAEPVVYPAITWRSGERGGTIPFTAPEKHVHLRWIAADERGKHPDLGRDLKAALQHGGCSAVICNTVRRAQETYTALRESFSAEELSLFHARFPYEERMEREKAALLQFGKPAETTSRPRRAVIVATQVIEQSLDLDFDLMVTELAPVDLVLQRSGRLHRHKRERPPRLREPELWLLAPPEHDGLPVLPGPRRAVYDQHVLLRSWLALREQNEIAIPHDVTLMIEAVYDDSAACPREEPSALPALWDKTHKSLVERRGQHEFMAQEATIRQPGADTSAFLEEANKSFEEDDPGIHETLRALTRLGEASITAICLTPEEAGRLRPDGSDAGRRAAELLRRSVNLTHGGIVDALIKDSPPPSWKRTALLRHCRLVTLDGEREAVIGGYRLRLDRDLGVVIE